jgi:hypothetical protein
METPDHISSLRLIGGNLALDFANTAEGTSEGEIEQEHLLGYEDLVFWGHRVGYLSAEDGGRVGRDLRRPKTSSLAPWSSGDTCTGYFGR